VSRGEEEWVPLLERFWKPFKAMVVDKSESVDRSEATGARELGVDPKSGKPVSVRLGRYGPYAQIGTADDDEKPTFASLRGGQSMHTISLEEALKLFGLPRKLGFDGEHEVSVGVGRFGPFAKRGATYASLAKEDDPYTITFERAVELVRAREELIANRTIRAFEGTTVQVLNGRFGPYITDGEKNGKIPKDREPASMTLAECQQILAETGKPVRKGGRFGKKAAPRKAATKAAAAPAEAKATKKPAKKAAKKKAAKKAPRKAAKAAEAGAGRGAGEGRDEEACEEGREEGGEEGDQEGRQGGGEVGPAATPRGVGNAPRRPDNAGMKKTSEDQGFQFPGVFEISAMGPGRRRPGTRDPRAAAGRGPDRAGRDPQQPRLERRPLRVRAGGIPRRRPRRVRSRPRRAARASAREVDAVAPPCAAAARVRGAGLAHPRAGPAAVRPRLAGHGNLDRCPPRRRRRRAVAGRARPGVHPRPGRPPRARARPRRHPGGAHQPRLAR
jgi:topoisomerase IA-like protein